MNEKMQEFRATLKKNIAFNAICAAILLAVQVLAWLGIVRPVSASERFQDYWNGFIAGASLGIMALMIFGIIICIRALRNEERLKKLYIKLDDERVRTIGEKAKGAAANIFLLGMLPITIVSGYFSSTVFFSLLGAEVFMALTTNVCKLYYKKKL